MHNIDVIQSNIPNKAHTPLKSAYIIKQNGLEEKKERKKNNSELYDTAMSHTFFSVIKFERMLHNVSICMKKIWPFFTSVAGLCIILYNGWYIGGVCS